MYDHYDRKRNKPTEERTYIAWQGKNILKMENNSDQPCVSHITMNREVKHIVDEALQYSNSNDYGTHRIQRDVKEKRIFVVAAAAGHEWRYVLVRSPDQKK